jgi:bacteriorhodopsin
MEEITLTAGQHDLIYNLISMTLAVMGGAFIFFLASMKRINRKHRASMIVSAVIVAIAGYHYWRIFGSFESAATMLEGGGYAFATEAFNDAYRYVDWIITVPLLMVELVLVLDFKDDVRRKFIAKMSVAAFLMIALGYPGEVATSTSAVLLWGTLSTIPFLYLLYVLWSEIGTAIEGESDRVKVLMRNTRLLILATWGVYPIAYLAPVMGFEGATALVVLQVGYCLADMTAKAGYGVMIYSIARQKTVEEGGVTERVEVATGGAAAVPE